MFAGAVLALAVAAPAVAAPRDLDRTFGADGATLTPVGTASAAAAAIARQRDGRLILVGNAKVSPPADGHDDTGVAIVRYLAGGTVDRSFGGGDGVVVEQFGSEGSLGQAVTVQRDGKILVAGASGYPVIAGPLFVARYLPDGSRDTSFGDGGVAYVPVCCDASSAGGLAIQSDGKIVLAGYVDNTDSADAIVARFTPGGRLDSTYGDGGVSRLQLGDGSPRWSRATSVVIQGGKAVIAGDVVMGGDRPGRDIMVARLDEHGALDSSFGTEGLVSDRPVDRGWLIATALALWHGKLVVAGDHSYVDGGATRSDWVLARYDADGHLDTSFNADGPAPGHVVATAGSDREASANGLAIDPVTGSATITGFAHDQGREKLLLARYTSDGARDDAGFRSASGNVGPRLLDAGDGGTTLGNAVLLDPYGGTLVAGAAVDAGASRFLLARYGDPVPPPNRPPVARIDGPGSALPATWISFRAAHSCDPDGHIVAYAWRVGYGRYRSAGPSFTHRFPQAGAAKITLRVTDDRGAVAYATLRVRVR